MAKKTRILLPNPADYINFISGIVVDFFTSDSTTTSKVVSTVKIAKLLVNEETFLIVEDTHVAK